MAEFRTCARLEDVPEGALRGVEVDGRQIVLAHRDGDVYALEDCCSHEQYPLSAGEMTGDQVTCALHGARFDLSTGDARALPAVMPVETYETRVTDEGEIQVKL